MTDAITGFPTIEASREGAGPNPARGTLPINPTTREDPPMTAYTLDMASSPEVHPVILKAMRTSEYQPPVPTDPRYAVNPDGVRYDRVAHLPSMQEPDVAEWVARHADDDVHIMVAFARGRERGQVDPGEVRSYEIATSTADMAAIRVAARREMKEHHRSLGIDAPDLVVRAAYSASDDAWRVEMAVDNPEVHDVRHVVEVQDGTEVSARAVAAQVAEIGGHRLDD